LAGTTVMQRLTMLRMEQAANALVQTNQDLTTICDGIGIADPPYFCRLFKRYFNRTPMHYRQMFRQ
ncbi:MAG TPA: helix-turn-helix domain-containing protein, partial [Armatimonadota bacterium]|nr:helix-turn-helix domain-containing protein [Armatimonadota bacterium]